jgi:hypothetical protein
MLGHVAGLPVEETLLSLLPLGVAGVAGMSCWVRRLVRQARRRSRSASTPL